MFCLYFSEANNPISIKFGEQMSKVYSEYGDVDKKKSRLWKKTILKWLLDYISVLDIQQGL